MKLPWRLLFLMGSYFVFFGTLLVTFDRFPERVATHFDASGRPNGWMNQSTHFVWFTTFTVLVPLLIVAICASIRIMPPTLVNIPHRAHWMAPAHRPETSAYLLGHSLVLAGFMVCFLAGLHLVILHANQRTPPELSGSALLLLSGMFLLGVIGWVTALVWRFRRPRDE